MATKSDDEDNYCVVESPSPDLALHSNQTTQDGSKQFTSTQ